MSLLSGLISYWPLNEPSGVAYDAHGSNHLACSGHVDSVVNSNLGRVRRFNGSKSWLLRPDNSSLSVGNEDFTLTGWLYLVESGAAGYTIVSKYNYNASDREFYIDYNTSIHRFRFGITASGSAFAEPVLANNQGPISLSGWYFVAGWYDSVNDKLGIQVNNRTPNHQTYTSGCRDGTSEFNIGALFDINYTNGYISNVGFWRRTLTSHERKLLYNNGNPPQYPFEYDYNITAPSEEIQNINFINWSNPINRNHPLNKNVIGWWPIIKNANGWGSSKLYDAAGSNHGTLINYTAGSSSFRWLDYQVLPVSYILKDTSGSIARYIEIPFNTKLAPSNEIVLCGTFNATVAPTTNTGLIARWDGLSTQRSYNLYYTSAYELKFAVSTDGTYQVANDFDLSQTLPFNTTVKFYVLHFKASNFIRLYVNGVLVTELTSSIPSSMHVGTAPLWIGQQYDTAYASSHKGALSDIRIMSTISSAEVRDLYHESHVNGYKNLFNYIPVTRQIEHPDSIIRLANNAF